MSKNIEKKYLRPQTLKDWIRHYLADIVYGGNDGIVTTFAIICGVTGAKLSFKSMFIIAAVNLLADGFSMAASNYLSIRSKADAYGKEHKTIEPMGHAFATFLSFFVFGSVPMFGFLIHPFWLTDPFIASSILAAITMILLGALRASVSHRKWHITIAENLLIGSIASLVAFFCGKLMSDFIA